jgi:hypothetical protein
MTDHAFVIPFQGHVRVLPGAVGTPASAPTAPVNSVAPAITGTAEQGSTLSCSTGTWSGSPTGYAYQWKRGGVAISGATSSTYLIVSADVGVSIKCTVTATNVAGSASADSNSVTPVAVFDPVSLFTAGRKGGVYDATNAATRFTDTGGTTAANSGDPVGRLSDRTANANHLLQATAAARGLVSTLTGTTGILFDGVDDCLRTGAFAGGTIAAPYAVIMAVRKVTHASPRYLHDGGADDQCQLSMTASGLQFFAGGVLAETSAQALSTADIVTEFLVNGASSRVRVDLNTPVTGNGGSNTLTGLSVASAGVSAQHSNILLTRMVVIANPTETEIAQLRTWCAAGQGRVL